MAVVTVKGEDVKAMAERLTKSRIIVKATIKDGDSTYTRFGKVRKSGSDFILFTPVSLYQFPIDKTIKMSYRRVKRRRHE